MTLNTTQMPESCLASVSGSTFVNADCFDVFPFFEDKSIDAIICDLPYGTTACKWDSILPLDKLWKEYIYKILLKIEDSSINVSFQNRDKFWEEKIIKPDIVITKTEFINEKKVETKYIIDTKWKVKEYPEPDDDDLKQMYVYNMYWKSERSMLLYPTSKDLTTKFGKFHKGREENNLCKLGFIKVMKGLVLNSNIGNEIADLIELNYQK